MMFQVLNNVGTYVAAKFTDSTLDELEGIQKQLKLLNPVARSDLHSTICYSRKYIKFPVDTDNELISVSQSLRIFETSGGPALVLELDSEHLCKRHELAKLLGATYDFPDYIPHITLSYNIGGQYVDTSKTFSANIVKSHEYSEDLDTSWADDKK